MTRLAGFRFNGKKGVAHFEVVVPGTSGLTRKRRTIEVRDIAEATTKYHEFREDVLGGRRTEPWTFAEYAEDRGPALQGRLAESARRREKQVSRKPGPAVFRRRPDGEDQCVARQGLHRETQDGRPAPDDDQQRLRGRAEVPARRLASRRDPHLPDQRESQGLPPARGAAQPRARPPPLW